MCVLLLCNYLREKRLLLLEVEVVVVEKVVNVVVCIAKIEERPFQELEVAEVDSRCPVAPLLFGKNTLFHSKSKIFMAMDSIKSGVSMVIKYKF